VETTFFLVLSSPDVARRAFNPPERLTFGGATDLGGRKGCWKYATKKGGMGWKRNSPGASLAFFEGPTTRGEDDREGYGKKKG